ncbi:MAG: hypothetical protein HC831_21150 [Chloroflexia bacterium]|nr:hypothetical protein [Chloroflexia bacterium]
MKKIVLILTLAILGFSLNAQNAEYYQAMGQNLRKLGEAKTSDELQSVGNQFELIANKEQNEWLPLYYAAQSTILMVHRGVENDKIDSYLDYAQKFIDKALTISEKESEIYVLQGFLHQARIGVNSMSRGQKYSALAYESFEKAKALNAENPRIYYLMAMSVLNTPKMFGGGKKNALPLFLQAKEKFDAFKPASTIFPNWGAEHNQQMLDKCQS